MESFNRAPGPKKIDMEAVERESRSFGRFLGAARAPFKEKSQASIGKQLGVSAAKILTWESGISFPKEEELERVAEAYGIVEAEAKKEFLKRFYFSLDAKEKLAEARKAMQYKKGR